MRKMRGFTLIETAIVLMIAGLLMASILQFATVQMRKQRYDTTRERLQNIRTALTSYVVAHNRLPCPAGSAGEEVELDKKGAETAEKSPDPLADGCPVESKAPPGVTVAKADKASMETKTQVWIGTLPIRDLRITAEMSQDGWGNKFTYAVSRKLTLKDGMRGNPPPKGVISIEDGKGKSVLSPPKTGRYVVISHGPTGAGAWTPHAKRIPCKKGSIDMANCDNDAQFVLAPFSLAGKGKLFDDFVIHDDPQTSGSLLDRIVTCNTRRKFYVPTEPGADEDGCKGPSNMWEGACVQSETLTKDDVWVKHPPNAIMPPAAAGNECACGSGYRAVKIALWDDGVQSPPKPKAPAGGGIQIIDAATGQPATGIVALGPDGTPAAAGESQPSYTRTALWTCMQ